MVSPVKISGAATELPRPSAEETDPSGLMSSCPESPAGNAPSITPHQAERLGLASASGCSALTSARKRSRMGSAKVGFHTRLISHSE